jgi:L-histidine Nalpha-methyltransferase
LLLYDTDKYIRNNDFANQIQKGLEAKKKYVHPKYFYDQIGSDLFEKISEQPEYYLTRTESSLLEKYSKDIYRICGNRDISIVELGSGSSSKTRILLDTFLSLGGSIYYFPIDVSESMLSNSINNLFSSYRNLGIIGVCSEFSSGAKRVKEFITNHNGIPVKKLLLFLGSSIGNFEPFEVRIFLTELASQMNHGDTMLIGFDLQKEKKYLEKAYNDAAGITAKFNLNILARINRELSGDFELSQFKHEAFYNMNKKRIEMHLTSLCDQSVLIRDIGQQIVFRKGERIHTENSYKFSLDQINALVTQSGLTVLKNYVDDDNLYCLSHLGYVSSASESGK